MDMIKMLNKDVTTIVGDTNSALSYTSNLIRPCDPKYHKKSKKFSFNLIFYTLLYCQILNMLLQFILLAPIKCSGM